MAQLPKVSIRKGREFQVSRGHPWLFSGAISQAPGRIAPGALVDLVDTDGKFIARGYYNPACDIAVRVLSRDQEEIVDREFFRKRIERAYNLRRQTIDMDATNAFRLVHAEGDFLPGFIVDYYDGVAVVQSHTAGADNLMDDFLSALDQALAPRAVIVRNDAVVRAREGMPLAEPAVRKGQVDRQLTVKENGHAFVVDVLGGQKTGFFTDQREKRANLQNYCRQLPPGGRLANVFSYTGAFGVYAALANTELATINVDASAAALELARRNYELNGIAVSDHHWT
jgi:23S rRNA (cytosine1962-C5)-methyltransferase